MYTEQNFKTKKALKEAVASGKRIGIFQPGGIFTTPIYKKGDTACVEGPHYPAAHSWYAQVTLGEDGCIDKVK